MFQLAAWWVERGEPVCIGTFEDHLPHFGDRESLKYWLAQGTADLALMRWQITAEMQFLVGQLKGLELALRGVVEGKEG